MVVRCVGDGLDVPVGIASRAISLACALALGAALARALVAALARAFDFAAVITGACIAASLAAVADLRLAMAGHWQYHSAFRPSQSNTRLLRNHVYKYKVTYVHSMNVATYIPTVSVDRNVTSDTKPASRWLCT